jgi:signal transduction histidine kinase
VELAEQRVDVGLADAAVDAVQDVGERPFGVDDVAAGVGLGLVVSRGLTEAMGGTVKPEETPGGGLTMVVSLPQALANGAPGSCTYQACLRQRP